MLGPVSGTQAGSNGRGVQGMRRTAAAISVLLVEDEVMISNLVAGCLSESGFHVHEVATADEALHLIKSGANVDLGFGILWTFDFDLGMEIGF